MIIICRMHVLLYLIVLYLLRIVELQFFPIKTFASSLDKCQTEYVACKSVGGSDCNGWARIKSQWENSFGRSLFPDSSGNGSSGFGDVPNSTQS